MVGQWLEISKECCLFIHHGGSITDVVKGRRHKTLDPCGGMKVLCEVTFRHSKERSWTS